MREAQLLLDTARAATGAGMRSAGGAPRQLVFWTRAHRLDLVETAPSGGGAARFIWGQLLLTVACTPCEGAAISLLDDAGSVVADAMTDEFGEFRLGGGPASRSVIRVDTGDGSFTCRIPPAAPAAREPSA